MTRKHYHHHIDEATGEPTTINIGEPYPEELDPGVDPELHESNRIKGRVADAALEKKRTSRVINGRMPTSSTFRQDAYAKWNAACNEYERALAEYEKMVSVEAGE